MKFSNKNTSLIYCWLTEDPDIRLFCIREFSDILDPADYFKTDRNGICHWEVKLQEFVERMIENGVVEDGRLWRINFRQVNFSQITAAFLDAMGEDIEDAKFFKSQQKGEYYLNTKGTY